MWRRCDNTSAAPCATTGEFENPENFFNSGLRNLNIKIKAGNAGAVAIRHSAAQRSYQENISIDMTESGYAGYLAIPGYGSSSVNNIEITGGKYGIYLDGDDARRATVSNITLTNQTVAAIYTRPRTDFVVTGFKITKQTAPAIVLNYGGVFGSEIIMVDGIFEFTNPTSTPAITSLINSVDDYANTTLYNVYFNKATNLIKTANKPAVTGNSSGWTHLTEYFVPSSHNGSYVHGADTVTINRNFIYQSDSPNGSTYTNDDGMPFHAIVVRSTEPQDNFNHIKSKNVKVTNNLLVNRRHGVSINEIENVLIADNTILRCRESCIRQTINTSNNVRIINNILEPNPYFEPFEGNGNGITFQKNHWTRQPASPAQGQGDIYEPLALQNKDFSLPAPQTPTWNEMRAMANNYRLQANALDINAGISLTEITTDFYGTDRRLT